MNRYDPARHELVGVEVVPSYTGYGRRREIFGWFVRVWYTGDPVREFTGKRGEVTFYETEAEARRAADELAASVSHDLLR